MSKKAAWIGDSARRQIQGQSAKYSGGVEMSGYAVLTRSTTMPVIWVNANLGEVCTKLTDGSHNPPESITSGLPMLSARNIQSGRIDFSYDYRLISPDQFEEEDKRTRIAANDLLLTIVGALGRVALVTDGLPKFTLQRSVAVLTAPKLHPEYFRYALEEPDFQKQIFDNAKGTAQKGIYLKKLSTLEIKLPSFAEQQQIAAKLDELLAQVDSIKTRLDAIPKILKRFRQSVLAAAVSGKLTEDWRGSGDYNKSELGWLLPTSWKLLVIDDLAEVKGGKRLPKGETLVSENTGYPYIRAGQLKDGTVTEDDQLFLLEHVQKKISRYIVNTRDLYITIVGACIGDAGIIPSNYDGANLTENAAKLCLFKKPLDERYLSNWLRSQYLQDIIQHEIKSGAQGKLALKRIKTLPVPFPTLEEQTEIVNRVEQLFTYADQIEQRVKDAQARVNHLTQAILAKAFRGELTADWRAQNPELISGENSAEALLKRIKAEREPGKSGKKSKTS